jgi:hypothetical protein
VRSKIKDINSTGAPLVHVPGWVGWWVGGSMDGWVEVKAVLRIAYSNQKMFILDTDCTIMSNNFTQKKISATRRKRNTGSNLNNDADIYTAVDGLP